VTLVTFNRSRLKEGVVGWKASCGLKATLVAFSLLDAFRQVDAFELLTYSLNGFL
jgi:hypothetical protein